MLKRLFWIIALLIALVVAGGAYLYYGRSAGFTQDYLRTTLKLQDVTVDSFRITGTNSFVVNGITLDKDGFSTIDQVEVRHTNLTPELIILSGVKLSGEITTKPYGVVIDGVVFPEAAEGAEPAPLALPANIELNDATIDLDSPWGYLRFTAAGKLTREENARTGFDVRLQGSQKQIEIDAGINGNLSTTQDIAATLNVDGLSIDVPELAVKRAGGVLTVDKDKIAGNVTAGLVRLADWPLQSVTATIEDTKTAPSMQLDGLIQSQDDPQAEPYRLLMDIRHAANGDLTADTRLSQKSNDVGHGRLTYKLSQPDRALLDIASLNLAHISALTGWEGFKASGKLAGKLPLINKAGWQINHGELKGIGGTLAYEPDEYPAFLQGNDPRIETTRSVLRSLSIEELNISANGPLDKEMSVGVQIRGKSPDFTRPIHLNLNVDGPVLPLLNGILQPLRYISEMEANKQ